MARHAPTSKRPKPSACLLGCPSSTMVSYTTNRPTYTTTYDPDAPETFPASVIDDMTLYPIGNGSWTWVVVDDTEDVSGSISPNNSQ
ncbi:hypothetical protein [Slackia isoflavoniconvertens]|uniref:hypothetical protein n=1 Tax=Slackia isoflavoniconvertens TaxID=572010 RepID=UPI003AB9854D